MTTFYLIRHANYDLVGKVYVGRTPGIHLNEQGRRQSEFLAERLAQKPIQKIFSSPLERCQETAGPLAKKFNLEIKTAEALTEINFGDWTNKTPQELAPLEKWRQWTSFRSGSRIPNGDWMMAAQARFVHQMEEWCDAFPEETLALISHGDPIRSAVAYYLGVPLDLFRRIEITPASVSILSISEQGPKILCVNDCLA
ncbi:MAG: histidine phosphatase family protein [Limisphaerales bacterium]